MRSKQLVSIGLPAIVVVAVLIVKQPFSYSHAVQSGRSIPIVRSFESSSPKSTHSISYFSATHGQPTWNSECRLHGRYILTLQFPVGFNLWRNRVHLDGKPQFTLSEIRQVQQMSDGRVEVRYGSSVSFGVSEWELVARRCAVSSPEIENVLYIARHPEKWPTAHDAFTSVRDILLEGLKIPQETRSNEHELFLRILVLAELVAKVVYNCTNPSDPFDEDSGSLIVRRPDVEML